MKQYYKVSFKYSESVYCSNIAHAESREDVEAHYNCYEWVSVEEAAAYEVEAAQRKGMPIVEVEHIEAAKDPITTPKTKSGNYYTISDIEKMPEDLAFIYALDTAIVKDHEVYFIDFGGYFGYSAIVYCNGHQIRYANDYQMHHKSMSPEKLHDYYIQTLNHKLFTDEELKTVESYEDYTQKAYFLNNLYGLREDHISIWFCGSDAERAERQEKIKSMIYSPVCFAYFENADIVEKINKLFEGIEDAKDALKNDFEYQKSAFLYEMYNHEYGINWQADYDVVGAFANVAAVEDYTDLNELFTLAKFTDTQKSAYLAARTEYYSKTHG